MTKANKVLALIAFGFVAVIAVGATIIFNQKNDSDQQAQQKNKQKDTLKLKDLSPEELRAMGIEGDTPQDTLRTILAMTNANNKKADAVLRENEALKQENARLNRKNADVDNRINEAVAKESQAFLAEIDTLKNELLNVANKAAESASTGAASAQGFSAGDIPVGNGHEAQGAQTDGSEMRWVEPRGVKQGAGGKSVVSAAAEKISGFGTAEQTQNTNTESAIQNTQPPAKKSATTAVYTLPKNSTLLGSIAMTALIGRVPIGNNVTDPYPFKAIVGRKNLIANGIELPDMEGAIVSGTATGDWTLSCVRGNVKSLTFVFSDGRIVTSDSGIGTTDSPNSGNTGGGTGDSGIGWLSDEHGTPCVQGERKTNAPEYLGSSFLLAGASAAAQGLSQSQTTTVVDSDGIVGAVTGDRGQYVLGQALSDGLSESANWFRDRWGSMFDAVYVPPGRTVVVHIEKEIAIDYNKLGRKVKHRNANRRAQLD